MAEGSLNLRVGKQDFLNMIDAVNLKMAALENVIQRYGVARNNLNQFVEEGDSTYEAWCERIDVNVNNCKAALASLRETKAGLEQTVEQREGMTARLTETVTEATEDTKSVVKAAIKVVEVL